MGCGRPIQLLQHMGAVQVQDPSNVHVVPLQDSLGGMVGLQHPLGYNNTAGLCGHTATLQDCSFGMAGPLGAFIGYSRATGMCWGTFYFFAGQF